jgi:hypothetical protein
MGQIFTIAQHNLIHATQTTKLPAVPMFITTHERLPPDIPSFTYCLNVRYDQPASKSEFMNTPDFSVVRYRNSHRLYVCF